MSGDRLADIEELRRTGQLGAITVSDVLALVEIAKAAQVAATLDVAEQTATSETWFEPRGVKQKLRAALARLDSGAAE